MIGVTKMAGKTRAGAAAWRLASGLTLVLSGCSLFSASPPEPGDSVVVADLTAADPNAAVFVQPDGERLETGREAFDRGDYFKAMNELYPLAANAAQANSEAQRLVGVMFMRGLSVPVNPEFGREWLERSARQENVQAQWLLGRNLAEGRHLSQNLEQAMNWLERAANNGLAEAQFYLAGVYQRSKSANTDSQAFRWMLAAAGQGHLAAQNSVGLMYQYGVGVARDDDQAEAWFLQAASADLPSAQYHLSRYYADRTQQVEALAWLRKAAANGHDAALQRVLQAPGQEVTMADHLSLFGTPLVKAQRELLRKRIVQAGGLTLREQNSQWYDVYEASALIGGADRLFVGYSLGNRLPGELRYRFPGMNTPAGVARLIEMISNKYGLPQVATEVYEMYGLHAFWLFNDARIEVRRSWPDDALALRFVLQEQLAVIRDEQSGQATPSESDRRLDTY